MSLIINTLALKKRLKKFLHNMSTTLPFKISALVFVQNEKGEHLLIERRKAPNLGCWSPIGGKLDMHLGESPYECARREVEEEIGLQLEDVELHCFGYISEKSYEGSGHWLMFLFKSLRHIEQLPPEIDEGRFRFFSRQGIDELAIPETDRTLLWPYFDRFSKGFVGMRANCDPAGQLTLVEELKLNESIEI
ncbi:MAG: NUDIX hydrolase [Verrucomicrobiota bacterium]